MRKAMIAILILVLGLSNSTIVLQNAKRNVKQYPSTMLVTSVKDNVTTLVDKQGFEWQLTNTEDLIKDDIVSVVMNDNGTLNTIFDDKIADYKYSGYVSKLEAKQWVN